MSFKRGKRPGKSIVLHSYLGASWVSVLFACFWTAKESTAYRQRMDNEEKVKQHLLRLYIIFSWKCKLKANMCDFTSQWWVTVFAGHGGPLHCLHIASCNELMQTRCCSLLMSHFRVLILMIIRWHVFETWQDAIFVNTKECISEFSLLTFYLTIWSKWKWVQAVIYIYIFFF